MSKTKRDLLLATTRMIAEYSKPSGAPALGLTLPEGLLNAPRLNETISDEDYAWEIAKIGAMLPDILWRSALLTASVLSIRSLFFQCLHHRLPQLAAL